MLECPAVQSARAVVVFAALAAALGCDSIKSLYKSAKDPLVGTWREVNEEGNGNGETMTFEKTGPSR